MSVKVHDDRLTAYGRVPYHRIIAKNFIGGISWGVGSVVGATVIISFLVWILSGLDFIPGLDQLVTLFSDRSSNFPR